MCGIAGYVGRRRIDDTTIERCLRLMHHRGPDHAASYYHRHGERHVHLLHTRLSIIDLDPRANQPMRIGPQVMVFNGALYNYRELAKTIDVAASPLTTQCDTEVLLRIIMDHGWRGLDLCEGMWAFAVYDERTGNLHLCRDRFGEKPLHIYRRDGDVYFGSELKFVRQLLGKPLSINCRHVRRFMINGYKALYKHSERFFENVSEVPPSTRVTVGANGQWREDRYWTASTASDESMEFDEAVEGLRQRLRRAVEWRLRADVPVAFLLSGGVDSNALAGIARRELGQNVIGFTATCDDPRYDERDAARAAAVDLQIDHVLVELKPERSLDPLRQLVRHRQAPVATISYYAQWLVMCAIRQREHRVVMSGVGADELLTGYFDHHNAYFASRFHNAEDHATAMRAWREHVQPAVRNPFLRDPLLFVQNRSFRDHIFLDAKVFAECMVDATIERFDEVDYCEDLLRNRMLNELRHEIVPVMLHEDDLNAMHHGLENRSPFLDRHVVEWCQRIPTRHLIRNGFAKAVLRAAMSGIAPDCVLRQRLKTGFNAPVSAIVNLESPDVRRELLAESPIFEHVRRDAVQAMLEEHKLPNSRSKFIFNVLNCKLFLEECAA